MKKHILFYFIFSLASCAGGTQEKTTEKEEQKEEIDTNCLSFSFEYNSIIVNVQLNDTVTAPLLFDTGCSSRLVIDSSYAARMNILPPKTEKKKVSYPFIGSGIHIYEYVCKDSISIILGGEKISYPSYSIADLSMVMEISSFAGIFNIPIHDFSHIWELNLENKYLKVHNADSFSIPDKALSIPYQRIDSDFNIRIPLTLCNEKDTFSSNYSYIIDTGYSFSELYLFPPVKEVEYLWNLKKMILYRPYPHINPDELLLTHYFEADLFDQIHLDSLKVNYRRKENAFKGGGLLGMEFWEQFNMYFDLKNKTLGLLKYDNYTKKRITKDTKGITVLETFNMSKKDGKYFMYSLMKFVEDNLLIKSGLQIGDELISVNTYSAQDIYDGKITIWEIGQQSDSLKIKVIRDGSELTLGCKTIN